MSIATYIIASITIFYGLIVLLLHKASIRFHKMDEKVGNVESAEPPFKSETRNLLAVGAQNIMMTIK